MPREKAQPTKRAVHRFHEEAPESPPFPTILLPSNANKSSVTFADDEEEEEEADWEEGNDVVVPDKTTPLLRPFGQWEENENLPDETKLFSLTASDEIELPGGEAVISYLRIGLPGSRSFLNHVEAGLGGLGLFIREQCLVVRTNDQTPLGQPCSEGFSCSAFYPFNLLRALRKDVSSGSLRLKVSRCPSDCFIIKASVDLNSCNSLSPVVMEWLLSSSSFSTSTPAAASSGSSSSSSSSNSSSGRSSSDLDTSLDSPAWFIPSSEVFTTEKFLRSVSASSSTCCAVASGLGELGDELKGGGLITALRAYQLQGVRWLYDKLCDDDYTMEGSSCNAHESGRCDGWVPIRAIRNRNKGKESCSSSIFKQEKSTVWYNLITGQIVGDLPPLAGNRETERTNGRGAGMGRKSAVLADEMGMGKSVQVLSLVLLMKIRRAKERQIKEGSSMEWARDTEERMLKERGGESSPLKVEPFIQSNPHVVSSNEVNLMDEIIDDVIDGVTKIASTHTVGKAAKRKREDLSEYPCLCGRRAQKKSDLGWVECSKCLRWLHIRCCGFNNALEASKEDCFVCLACSCVRCASTNEEGVEGGEGGRKIPSCATLILMPGTLIAQWKSEVQKHFTGVLSKFNPSEGSDPLKSRSCPSPPSTAPKSPFNNPSKNYNSEAAIRVFVYEGCDDATLRRRGLSFGDVDPRTLASYDVVLMSLKTLTKEFHQVQAAGAPSSRTTRFSATGKHTGNDDNREEGEESTFVGSEVSDFTGKMYVSFPPPFMCIRWSLVVVDETQKIESEGVSQGLSLCMRLSAERRLCVTGTPVGSDRMSDLCSLCQFLQIDPYGCLGKSEWRRVFGEGSLLRDRGVRNRWLLDLFAPLVLRRTKQAVAEQLGLEATVTIVKLLSFSDFEVRRSLTLLSAVIVIT